MEVADLDAWDQLGDEIQRIRQKYGSHQYERESRENRILFRGQENASWALNTTLETFSNNRWHIWGYLNTACRCAPQLESYTDRSWEIPSWREVEQELQKSAQNRFTDIPHYDYLVHLRHHGFPSPLLDWTESPYVAAFFAFEKSHKDAERVALFAYIETPRGVKGGTVGRPEIFVQGPYVRTHRRHFLQQAWYTMAIETTPTNDWYYFVPHESVSGESEMLQDVFVKITIPATERGKALRSLYEHNITRFSLFQTEDALVTTLAYKEIEAHEL